MCSSCMNWDFDCNNELSRYPTPLNYPEDLNETFLKTHKICFKQIKQACSLAEDKLCKQDWNAKNVTAFLNNHGIKQSFIDKILDKCKPSNDNTCGEHTKLQQHIRCLG